MKTQAIVIPCFNRIIPLKRLMNSICNAFFSSTIDLVFSIDFSGSNEVRNICEDFIWPFGDKKIISHDKNIGLRANIIFCGDLLLHEYDRIILLEDDLIVGRNFCKYALDAADFYEGDSNIGGISLYSYARSEVGLFEFYPLKDDFDTFFMQWPSSWGQLWTRNQWINFKAWLKFDYDFELSQIPEYVKYWKNSWKKYFIAYLVETNRYFVFPYFSLSIEGGCPGTHVKNDVTHSLYNNSLNNNVRFKYREFDENDLFKYDCYFQPINRLVSLKNKKYLISFDLYGTKSAKVIKTDYVVTSKKCHNVIQSFSGIFFPLEMNVEYGIEGSMISLVTKKDFQQGVFPRWKKIPLRMKLSSKDMVFSICRKLKSKLLNLF